MMGLGDWGMRDYSTTPLLPLLHAESSDRIKTGGSPGWYRARQNCDQQQSRTDEDVDQRIERWCPVEHGLDQPRDFSGSDEPEDQSEDCRAEAVAEHEPHHLVALRPERDADTDLGGAL